jgi:hypothetical protein
MGATSSENRTEVKNDVVKHLVVRHQAHHDRQATLIPFADMERSLRLPTQSLVHVFRCVRPSPKCEWSSRFVKRKGDVVVKNGRI